MLLPTWSSYSRSPQPRTPSVTDHGASSRMLSGVLNTSVTALGVLSRWTRRRAWSARWLKAGGPEPGRAAWRPPVASGRSGGGHGNDRHENDVHGPSRLLLQRDPEGGLEVRAADELFGA